MLLSTALRKARLTLSCLKFPGKIFFWILVNFEYNSVIEHKLLQCLNEICSLSSYQHFSFKYFL